jgi:DNA-binding protein Fis
MLAEQKLQNYKNLQKQTQLDRARQAIQMYTEKLTNKDLQVLAVVLVHQVEKVLLNRHLNQVEGDKTSNA